VLHSHSASSLRNASGPVLTDINVSISRGLFIMVIGPVGPGKPSLLHCMLGEVSHTMGLSTIQEEETAFYA
jgi:ABC-type Mn2+/Zn2+ transport system ATPase subunit